MKNKCVSVILSLGLLSAPVFAGKDSLSHRLRVKARLQMGFAIPVGIICAPVIFGFFFGPELMGAGLHNQREAELLKAAYVVHNKDATKHKNTNKKKYSRREIRNAQALMDEYYNGKLKERFPLHRISQKDITEALAYFYEDGASDGLYRDLRYMWAHETHAETLTQLLFGDINTVHENTQEQQSALQGQKYAYEQRIEAHKRKLQHDIEYQKKSDEAEELRKKLNQPHYEEVFTELED